MRKIHLLQMAAFRLQHKESQIMKIKNSQVGKQPLALATNHYVAYKQKKN